MKNLKLYVVLFFSIIYFGCGNFTAQTVSNKKIDNLFKSWNSLTATAIQEYIDLPNQDQKKMYENRLLSLKPYLEIKDLNETNSNSIRYKFLSKITNKINLNSDFYIIEKNSSGEQLVIRSYLVLIENQNSKIIQYQYQGHQWEEMETFYGNYKDFKVEDYLVPFGTGTNMDDVIITHFKRGKVKASDFYLFFTMKHLNLE